MRKVLLYNGGMKVAGKSGVGRAMEHQARALESAGIPYTFDPKEDYEVVHLNTVFPVWRESGWFITATLRWRISGIPLSVPTWRQGCSAGGSDGAIEAVMW